MEISFTIPTYRQVDLVETCLKSLREYHPENEVTVVDDGSDIAVQQGLLDICKKYNAKVLTSFWNNGFGHSCNRGIDSSNADVVVLVNNDITFTSNITEEIKRSFEKDPLIGILGFLLFYPDGRIQHGGHFRYKRTNTFGHFDHGSLPNRAKDAYHGRYSIGVTGALMAVNKSMTNKIGAFKSGYGLAYEDVEICLRTWQAGWKVYYTANVNAIHHEGYTRGINKRIKKELGYWDQEVQSKLQFEKDLAVLDLDNIQAKVSLSNGTSELSNLPKKVIGINRRGAMGDCIMTTGIIEALKRRNPSSEILVSTLCKYAYENNPNVNKIYKNKELMSKRCDMFYDLDMIYEITPIKPVWVSYADHVFGKNDYNIHEIIPRLYDGQDDRINMLCKIKNNNIPLGDKYIVIHPAKSWSSRTISKEIWDQVIDYLLTKGYNILNIGQGADIVPTIKENVYNLGSQLTLHEIRELIKNAEMFITVDSGILHIAQTTNTNIIGIFSVARPSNRIFRPEKTIAIEPNTECKYCLEQVKPPVTFIACKHRDDRCIKSITAQNIIEGINKLKGEEHV